MSSKIDLLKLLPSVLPFLIEIVAALKDGKLSQEEEKRLMADLLALLKALVASL